MDLCSSQMVILLMHHKDNPKGGQMGRVGEGRWFIQRDEGISTNAICHFIGKRKRILFHGNNRINYLTCINLFNPYPMK